MNSEQLRITGLTGVEITLDIAGAGSRSYAFIIDWHIRLLLALAWFFPLSLLIAKFGHDASRSAFSTFFGFAVYPAVGIYLLYHPVLEILLRGRTPGKRIAGVRIVTRNGGAPSMGALLIRNLFRLIDSLPVLYLIGLLCCMLTAQRVRVGDMAAGTLLVLDESASARSLGRLGTLVAQSGLAPKAVELIDDLLNRWESLEAAKRMALATQILKHVDPTHLPGTPDDHQLKQRLQALLAQRH